jgi:hypothetical protein
MRAALPDPIFTHSTASPFRMPKDKMKGKRREGDAVTAQADDDFDDMLA